MPKVQLPLLVLLLLLDMLLPAASADEANKTMTRTEPTNFHDLI